MKTTKFVNLIKIFELALSRNLKILECFLAQITYFSKLKLREKRHKNEI